MLLVLNDGLVKGYVRAVDVLMFIRNETLTRRVIVACLLGADVSCITTLRSADQEPAEL